MKADEAEAAGPDGFRLRAAVPGDTDALCTISLATGHHGGNAAALYRAPGLMGLIYAAPYVALFPETCLVAQDDEGIVGFAVGAHDTRDFERLLETSWWPALRVRYREPTGDAANWDADQRRHAMMHHPATAPEGVVESYGAHMHVNLIARAQGLGLGRRLVERWMDGARAHGVSGVHVACNPANRGSLAFWAAMRFEPLDAILDSGSSRHVWMGRKIDL